METALRPNVSPARYRELEILAMQMMIQMPHHNMGECLIIRDLCANILRRWWENERLAEHEIAARKGNTLLVESGGSIVHLRPVSG